MAGRNRMPRYPDGPRININRGQGPRSVHLMALEEEAEVQHGENQRIVVENRRLMDQIVILERELVAAKDDIHRLRDQIIKLQTDKNSNVRGLKERGMKMEADLRAAVPLKEEVLHLRAEAKKLNVLRQDLSAQSRGLTQDIYRLRSENKQFNGMRADVDRLRKELADARRALEYEKKANEEEVEQKQAMERNLMVMAREVEMLRAEHLSMDRRTHGLGGGTYGLYNESRGLRYSGGDSADSHAGYGRALGSYNKRPRR